MLINENDFLGIKQISKHCSFDIISNYIKEREELDLISLIGAPMYFDLIENSTDSKYQLLLNGDSFSDCLGNQIKHFGLKRVLIFLSYANFVLESGYISTPFGMVQKLGEDSVPVPMSELTNLSNRNKRIAYDYFELTKSFICSKKDDYKLYNGDCKTYEKPIETRGKTFKLITKNKKIKRNGDYRNYISR